MDIEFKYKILNKELEIENKILMDNLQEKVYCNNVLKAENKEVDSIKLENIKLKDDNEFLRKEYEKLKIEMDKITYSRSYKIVSKIGKILKRR